MATPETWLFSIQFVILWKKKLDLVEVNSFECFRYDWKERDRSVVFYKSFSKPTVKVIKIVCQLLILHSAGGWFLSTGDVFHPSTLKQNH